MSIVMASHGDQGRTARRSRHERGPVAITTTPAWEPVEGDRRTEWPIRTLRAMRPGRRPAGAGPVPPAKPRRARAPRRPLPGLAALVLLGLLAAFFAWFSA